MKYSSTYNDILQVFLLMRCFMASDCAVFSNPSNKLLRFTFDDGPDGSGGATSQEYAIIENTGSLDAVARMRGRTHRSNLDDGRYGRSGVFYGLPDGTDTLLIENPGTEMEELLQRGETLTFQAWLKIKKGDSASHSIVFAHSKNWGIMLVDKEVVITISHDGEAVEQFLTGQIVPSDGEWHHLQVQSNFKTGSSRVSIDFGLGTTISNMPQPSGENGILVIGARYEGEMDEVSLSAGDLTETDHFSQNPESCLAQSSRCLEEVVVIPPMAYPVGNYQEKHSVPLRFKSVYNPDTCTSTNPCPLVIALTCWKESNIERDLEQLVDEGNFIVSLFDNHCADSPVNPRQTSYVSNHLFTSSPLKDVIIPRQYTLQVVGSPAHTTLETKQQNGGVVSLRGSGASSGGVRQPSTAAHNAVRPVQASL